MRFRTLAALLPLSCSLACGGASELPAPDATSLRTTASGAVVGFANAAGGHSWLGIPFAAPPVGELRWRAPRPARGWSETREALAHGPACMQIAGPMGAAGERGEPGGSEDCLTLNVYAPGFPPGEVPVGLLRLPVMVWIHGGGNSQGHAGLYDGADLAVQRGVIVVSIQYRLGAFGWFRHPALHGTDASADDRSGNYGTLDAIAALEWVRDNAAAFGGDSERVTIFGESAGGTNVLALLRSPRASGLFHRAISQSGTARSKTIAQAENYADDPEPGDESSSREVILRQLEREGRADSREAGKALAASLSDAEIASLLRGLSAPEFMRLFPVGNMGAMYHSPRLIQDGAVLSRFEALEAYRRGDYNQVPAILGTNRDEVKTFQLFSSPYLRHVGPYPIAMRDERMYDLLAEYGSRLWKARGVDEPATAMRGIQGSSVYGYRFDWDALAGLLWIDLESWLGAGHALEIPFVFAKLDMGPVTSLLFDPDRAELDQALSRAMTSYWTQFAYSGIPGAGRDGDLPRWAPWGGSGGSFLVFDAEDDGGIRMSGDTVTRAALVAAVAEDPRFESARERCEVYREMARGGIVIGFSDYAALEGGACTELVPPPSRY